MSYFAVIDTETNWDRQVMSIGVAVADESSFQPVEELYLILDPEYRRMGFYSGVLSLKGHSDKEFLTTREMAIQTMKALFGKYDIDQLYAYNAGFDKGCLQELFEYRWFDIMKVAAYRQHNEKIPACTECTRTGRLKGKYGVEVMMRMLTGNSRYTEVHNALCDAKDELELMRLIGRPLAYYSVAEI